MNIKSPYKVKEVIFQRRYPGYLYRREIVDDSEYGGDGHLEMVNCYTENGYWIGNSKQARILCKKYGLRDIQPISGESGSCQIGFNKEQQKWYGLSHRAIYGFGIGHKCKKGDCGHTSSDIKELYEQLAQDHGDEDLQLYEDRVELDHYSYQILGENEDGSLIMGERIKEEPIIFKPGRGEWVAETLDDAKQMAIDFADSVS